MRNRRRSGPHPPARDCFWCGDQGCGLFDAAPRDDLGNSCRRLARTHNRCLGYSFLKVYSAAGMFADPGAIHPLCEGSTYNLFERCPWSRLEYDVADIVLQTVALDVAQATLLCTSGCNHLQSLFPHVATFGTTE